jgi:hypothetical protein
MLRDDALALLASSKLHKYRIFRQALETAAKSPLALAEANLPAPRRYAGTEDVEAQGSPLLSPMDENGAADEAGGGRGGGGGGGGVSRLRRRAAALASGVMAAHYHERRIVDPSATPQEKFDWALGEITESGNNSCLPMGSPRRRSSGNASSLSLGGSGHTPPHTPPPPLPSSSSSLSSAKPPPPPTSAEAVSGGGAAAYVEVQATEPKIPGSSSGEVAHNNSSGGGPDSSRDVHPNEPHANRRRVVTYLRRKHDNSGGYARPMFPPGRMVHLRRAATTTRLCGNYAHTTAYDARWISRDELSPTEGRASESLAKALGSMVPYAISDHIPWHVTEAIDGVLSRIRTNTYDT